MTILQVVLCIGAFGNAVLIVAFAWCAKPLDKYDRYVLAVGSFIYWAILLGLIYTQTPPVIP